MATPPPPVGKTPPPKPKAPAQTARPSPLATTAHTPKTFSIEVWDGSQDGEKIVVYAGSGKGKSTLASTCPGAVFAGLDDGGRKLRHPSTGEALRHFPGIETFQDIRDSTKQAQTLLKRGETYVLDTITKAEEISEPYIFTNYKTDTGETPKTIEKYGWGKGYRHALEVMRLLLQDLEGLTKRGINVLILAQESSATVANAEGLDYLADGPKLFHTKQFSSRLELQEWADHIFRIGFTENQVAGAVGASKGKIVSRDTTRAIFTQGARHFFAKTRKADLPPVISFAEPSDDSVWQLLFNKETA